MVKKKQPQKKKLVVTDVEVDGVMVPVVAPITDQAQLEDDWQRISTPPADGQRKLNIKEVDNDVPDK